MTCRGCQPQCSQCGRLLLEARERLHGRCEICLVQTQGTPPLGQLALFEEDPDRRPYVWDLEE